MNHSPVGSSRQAVWRWAQARNMLGRRHLENKIKSELCTV